MSTPRPIFEEPRPELGWPSPPNPARIRYVGALRTEADLKAPRAVFEAIGDFFAGPKKFEPLYGPRGVVVTSDGARVFVADPGGRCLHMFDIERRRYRKAQRLGDIPLLSPIGLCLGPEEAVFLCDSETVSIHRLDGRDGALRASLRLPDELLRPVAMQYDPAADELYVLDVTAHDIKVLRPDGTLKRIVGTRGTGPGQFNHPLDLVMAGDRIWVADTGNHRIQAITRNGEPLVSFGRVGDAPGDLAMPKSVHVDADGHVYVVDGRFENVQIFNAEGGLLLFFGEEGTGPGEFWLPGDIFIESSGRIWVCDSYNRRVQVFQYVRDVQSGP